MLPFDNYPQKGRQLLGTPRELLDGPPCDCVAEFQNLTGHTSCAYCGTELSAGDTSTFPCVSHVIPAAEAARIGVPREFTFDVTNTVLSCFHCSFAGAGYSVSDGLRPAAMTAEGLAEFRDSVFAERQRMIACRLAQKEPRGEPLYQPDKKAA